MKGYRALIGALGASWLALASPAFADDGYSLWLRTSAPATGQAAMTRLGDSATLRLACYVDSDNMKAGPRTCQLPATGE